MKISTSLEHGKKIAGVSSRESARMMKLAGFDGVDMGMNRGKLERDALLDDVCAERILSDAEALKAEGLEIAQCHLPFYPGHIALPGDGSYQAYEDFMLPSMTRAMEICGQIGCPVAVSHPYFDLNSPEMTVEGNLRLIEKLTPYMEQNHVKLALENCYAHDGNYLHSHVSTPEGVMKILERSDERLVGACIDTGHANIFRIPIGDMARMYGKRLIALHVNGNAGKDEHAIPYTMSSWCEHMDFHDFSRALQEIGYQGYYNLELNVGKLPASTAQPYLNLAAAVGRALADLTD